MIIALTLAYIAAAALPIWGLIRVYSASTVSSSKQLDANSGNHVGATYGAVQHGVTANVEVTIASPRFAFSDLLLIGSGIAIGMCASIASLFIH